MPSIKDRRRCYPSDLTEAQWNTIKDFIPSARCGGRPRTTNLRSVVEGILYLVSSGSAWRYLPSDFPPWKTVYHYYYAWINDGTLKQVHDGLRRMTREANGKNEFPSYVIIDSQSVRAQRGESLAYDGFKKIRGRKRQILVDSLGLVHGIHIHAANLSDTKEGMSVFDNTSESLKDRVEVINADLGYQGTFEDRCRLTFGFMPLLKKRESTGQGRKKTTAEKKLWRKTRGKIEQPRRWVVERTFAWLNGYRRLARDYERTVRSSQTMLYLGMTQLMLRRLHPAK